MLRAGLIGFPSSGKTALFQLLTSAREAPRPAGRQEANVGVSRVPDDRLDRLTALFNPKKHVPATVEFADMGGATAGKSGAAALLDVSSACFATRRCRMPPGPSMPRVTRGRWRTS
jgi:ribosome-binding ATPase YchF (GTP1/OBG family)